MVVFGNTPIGQFYQGDIIPGRPKCPQYITMAIRLTYVSGFRETRHYIGVTFVFWLSGTDHGYMETFSVLCPTDGFYL